MTTTGRMSHAHEDQALRADNPLYERAGSISSPFKASLGDDDDGREARRESFMVKRQQARPVLRPSPSLALGSDGAAFDAQWEQERVQARPVKRDR